MFRCHLKVEGAIPQDLRTNLDSAAGSTAVAVAQPLIPTELLDVQTNKTTFFYAQIFLEVYHSQRSLFLRAWNTRIVL